MSDSSETDAFLAHFGVKGMKWGRRKAEDSGGDSSGAAAKPAKLTRKEVKFEKQEFYNAKATRIFEEAAKDPSVLVRVSDGYNFPTVVTGREFVNYMAKGGVMDIRATDVYARQVDGKGPYVLNDKANEKFVRSDKKK